MDNGVMPTENALRCVAKDIELYYKKKAPNGAWCIATCRNAAAQFEKMRSELAELRREQAERSKGCAFCNGGFGDNTVEFKKLHYKFCRYCGRKLEVEHGN